MGKDGSCANEKDCQETTRQTKEGRGRVHEKGKQVETWATG